MTELRQLENETVRELGRRTAMLQAVTFAATQIVTAADWRHEIPELLRRLGLATDMSRVTLFEVHDGANGEMVQSCRFDWAEPGFEPISTNPLYQNIFVGVILVAAVAIDQYRRRRRYRTGG